MRARLIVHSIESSLRHLTSQARRHGLTGDEADDLVQDVLLAALEQGRALDDPRFPAWAAGVLRRHALFMARTAGRRRRREAAYAAEMPSSPAPLRKLPESFVSTLPPSLRTVALLANAGLGRAEIASLLRIADTALRQRISSLRRAWRRAGLETDSDERLGVVHHDGPRRRALKVRLSQVPGARLAVTDPDGNAIFLSDAAHKTATRGN